MNANARNAPATKAGFTLIELLVVISIIGLLVGLIIPSLGAAKDAARVAKTKSLINTLETGVESFKAEVRLGRQYPPSYWEKSANLPYWAGGTPPDSSGNTPKGKAVYGAQLLFWAVGGPDLKGTAGFQDDLSVLYDPTRSYVRYGPFVDVNKNTDIYMTPTELHNRMGTVTDYLPSASTGGRPTGNDDDWPVFIDAFGYPIVYYRAEQPDPTATTDLGRTESIYKAWHNAPFVQTSSDHLTDDALANQLLITGRIGNLKTVQNGDSYILMSPGPDGLFYGPEANSGKHVTGENWGDNIANFPINPVKLP
jgi:prepilin-type N-terminal cleavage/methylation domain-containing protein